MFGLIFSCHLHLKFFLVCVLKINLCFIFLLSFFLSCFPLDVASLELSYVCSCPSLIGAKFIFG